MDNPPCAECGEAGMVGIGSPPVWLCLVHFDAQMMSVGLVVTRLLQPAQSADPKEAS